MRILQLVAVLFLVGSAPAQNWALIDPTYKYNYSNNGSDTISNQLFALDVQPIGQDSFLYELNTITRPCALCSGVPPACAATAGWYVDRPQVYGLKAIAHGSQWTLFGDDTLLVEAAAASGTTWMGPGGVQGSVSAVMEEDLFGQLDSLKQIAFSNGVSMKISKAHGVTFYSADGGSYALIGVQGGLDAGEHFPGVIDLFDYQVGDILQYRGTNDGTDGVCYFNTIYTKKYEVLSRTDLPGHTDYSVRLVENSQTWAFPIIGMGECSWGGSSSGESIIPLGIEHDHWTQDNFLGSCWLSQFWPQAFGEPLISGEFAGEFGSNDYGSPWHAYLNEQQRYVMEPVELYPGQLDAWPAVAPCFEDTTFWPEAWERIIGRYVEGIGFTYGRYMGFEHSSEKILEAYRIGGVEYGEITPDDIILGLEGREPSTFSLSPNPVVDAINIQGAPAGGLAEIRDSQGRSVASFRITSSNQSIPVHQLGSGAYLLRIDGLAPQRFVIAR